MRTGGRRRGVLKVLRSRSFMAVCLVALLAGLVQLEIAGHSVGAFLGRLLVSPADARKAHGRVPRAVGADLRRPQDNSPFAAFAPSTQPPAFQPAAKPPAFAPSRPFRPAETRRPSGFFGASKPVRQEAKPIRQESWSDRRGRHGDDARAFARGPAGVGGWEVLVKQAAAPAATDRTERQLSGEPASPPAAVPSVAPPDAKARPTFHHLVEKLSSRSPHGPGAAKTAAVPRGTKPRESAAPGANGARPAVRRLGGRPAVTELLPPVGTFRPNEVLAINLSAEGLAKARDGNYQVVEHIALPEFGLTITKLQPPDTLNAINGRDRLFDLLPQEGFTLNRVYVPYRPSAGRPPAAGSAVSAQNGKGCPTERCFGSTLIKWQPRLAACARDIKIGMVDTGFDKGHPAFAGVRYEYREFLPEGSARASNEHGTGVFSLLAGNADSGTPGLIPDAAYVIANTFFADADGQPLSDTSQMLQALHWLKKSGVAVVNLSFTGPEDEVVHHAVQELTKAGIVVVAAAGNDGPSAPPSYPAGYEEVIAVTAVDRNLAAYRYANRGEHIDVAAPGVEVWTAMPGRREGPQTGTSFAVPYVTAVVAVTLPAGLSPNDDALAAKQHALDQIRANVKALGVEGRDQIFGAGLVQAPASCDAPPAAVVANVAPASQPWTGTVRRAPDSAGAEPLVVGSWMSTVHAVSSVGR